MQCRRREHDETRLDVQKRQDENFPQSLHSQNLLAACRVTNSSHVAPLRFGLGSSPVDLRILCTVFVLIDRTPSFFTSPTIRA
jgi:hypothetical protein